MQQLVAHHWSKRKKLSCKLKSPKAPVKPTRVLSFPLWTLFVPSASLSGLCSVSFRKGKNENLSCGYSPCLHAVK